jgi:hypothetical protein
MDDNSFTVNLTAHASIRMQQRRISETAVVIALLYGREVHTREACICVLGRKKSPEAGAMGWTCPLTPASTSCYPMTVPC